MVDIRINITTGKAPDLVKSVPAMIQAVIALQNRTMADIVTEGQRYPPELPNQKYQRTYVLHDSWHIVPARVNGDVIRGQVYNNATENTGRGRHYASYVYGSTAYEQAPIHRGRWPTRHQLFNRQAYEAELRRIQEGT